MNFMGIESIVFPEELVLKLPISPFSYSAYEQRKFPLAYLALGVFSFCQIADNVCFSTDFEYRWASSPPETGAVRGGDIFCSS